MAEPLTVYNSGFYEGQREGSRRSAQRIVPELLRLMDVNSVVDVGCGVGTWLRVFQDLGVKEIFGIDGDYVDTATLEVDKSAFKAHDLQTPLRLDRQFDLVVSLEVAEHIPPEKATAFVQLLTGLGPVLMFSAAIPFQNGNNHVNEQWPDYWAELFRAQGYVPVDCIRPKVWSDAHVEAWYAQNTIVYVKEDRLPSYPGLQKARAQTSDGFLSMVHPKLYFKARYEAQLGAMRSVKLDHMPVRRILSSLPSRLMRAVNDHLRGQVPKPFPAQIAHPSEVPLSETQTAVLPRQAGGTQMSH